MIPDGRRSKLSRSWGTPQKGREGIEEAWENSNDFHEQWKMKARDILGRTAYRQSKIAKRVRSEAAGGLSALFCWIHVGVVLSPETPAVEHLCCSQLYIVQSDVCRAVFIFMRGLQVQICAILVVQLVICLLASTKFNSVQLLYVLVCFGVAGGTYLTS